MGDAFTCGLCKNNDYGEIRYYNDIVARDKKKKAKRNTLEVNTHPKGPLARFLKY